MRILFVGQQSLSSPSGLGRHLPLAKELARRGHQTRLIALHHDWENLAEKQSVIAGVEVEYVGQMQVLKRAGAKRHFPPAKLAAVTAMSLLGLRRAIQSALNAGFSVVHLLKPQPINGLAWILAQGKGAKVAFFVDCDDYEFGYAAQRSFFLSAPVAHFEKRMPRTGLGVTYHTEAMKSKLRKWGVAEERLWNLPNGVERDRFFPRDAQCEEKLIARYRPDGQPLVLYVGSLEINSHAVDLLLTAFAQVLRSQPRAKCLLIGTGSDLPRLQKQATALGIGQAVTFAGPVPGAEVPAYLRIASVSVEPTRDTPVAAARFPLKVLESMAAGTPVVCGNVGERARILRAGTSAAAGLAVAPGDPSALCRGILSVLNRPELAAQFSANGLARSEDFFWDRLAPTVEEMYARA